MLNKQCLNQICADGNLVCLDDLFSVCIGTSCFANNGKGNPGFMSRNYPLV